jgi:hypothetical protein
MLKNSETYLYQAQGEAQSLVVAPCLLRFFRVSIFTCFIVKEDNQ